MSLAGPVVQRASKVVLPDQPDGPRIVENMAYDAVRSEGVGPRIPELEERDGLVFKPVIFNIVEPFGRTQSG